MKRIIISLLLMALLCFTAVADELVTSPLPEATEEEERQALIESLHKGIIPITPDMTYDEFMSYMQIIDESDNRMLTAKFDTFLRVIEAYHYGNMTFYDVFDRFVHTVDSVDINNMDEAYATMFSMMDRFSYYLNPEEAESFFSPTSSKGIGIKMVWHDAEGDLPAGIYVDEVAKGSTAESAGIAVGDRIVEFNGIDMRGLGFEALGVYSTSIDEQAPLLEITLSRNGEEKKYVLDRMNNFFPEYRITLYPEKKLIYLVIDSFMYEDTALSVGAELDRAYADGYRNVIIDLQGNTGGDVYVAAGIASKFIPDVEFMFAMGRDGSKTTVPFISMGDGHRFDKINVLVDSKTASSSEILAYTLRNLAGAKISGQKTFGKGVAQSVISFEDGSAVGITAYVAYDSKGNTYNEVGILPDNKVTPIIEKNKLPEKTPAFTVFDYAKAREGGEASAILGLEIRLEALGFLSPDRVDGNWDNATGNAVKAFRIYIDMEEDATLDRESYLALMDMVKKYENSYYYTFTAFDYAYRLM